MSVHRWFGTNLKLKLANASACKIERIHQTLLSTLERNIPGLGTKKKDASVYTGISGFAYLYLLIHLKENDRSALQKGISLVEQCLKQLRFRDVTFLCGDSGPLCIGAALHHCAGNLEKSRELTERVLGMSPRVLEDKELPNELLYGRVGYLYSLLFLKKYVPDCNISGELLSQVAHAVIAIGQCGSNPPLMWTWHEKKYLGGAHGVAGILFLLLQVKSELSESDMKDIRRTVDYLLSIRFPSGNFPSSLGSRDDCLVHWCHGAPGIVQLLLAAYETWRDTSYLQAAEQCGEIVWTRGLLRKGCGICHGVAGNAYTFLALYQVTRIEKHLHRAVQFAEWCEHYDENQDQPADRPFSLFEGLAGTVYFLKDIQNPLDAMFPAYSITPFNSI